MEKNILIIAANPKDTSPLRITNEVKEIEITLKDSQSNYKVNNILAATDRDLRKGMLASKPVIVHFCGHGEGESGIVLEDNSGSTSLIPNDALAKLFKYFSKNLECVLLNACYSEIQANEISKHVDYVIGMNNAIGDKAAIEFATGFYDALAAGESYESAYQMGRIAIEMKGIPEHLTPVLKTKQQAPVKTSQVYQTFESRTVFLAEVPDDLQKQRTNVKNYLEQHNIEVVPSKLYYFENSNELIKQIEIDLKKSSLYIQLLSDTKPDRPEGMTTPELQYDMAMANSEIPKYFWRDTSLDLAQVNDESMLKLLDSPKVMATLLEDFKETIIQKLKDLIELEQKQKNSHGENVSDKFVFINTSKESEDLVLANNIKDFLEEKGLFPALPLLDNASPSEIRQDLEGNLYDCDAVILLYVKSTIGWIRQQIRQCHKIMKKRTDNPLKIISIFDSNDRAQRTDFGMGRLPNMEILECPSLHADTCLPKFLKKLNIL